jgi:hypothetical protein
MSAGGLGGCRASGLGAVGRGGDPDSVRQGAAGLHLRRRVPAEEVDVGAAAPGVSTLSPSLRCWMCFWRGATRHEVLWFSAVPRSGGGGWQRVAGFARLRQVWRIGGDDFVFGELRLKALQRLRSLLAMMAS